MRPPFGQVAQLVEQRIENPRVGGSIPPLATKIPARAQPAKLGSLLLALETITISHEPDAIDDFPSALPVVYAGLWRLLRGRRGRCCGDRSGDDRQGWCYGGGDDS